MISGVRFMRSIVNWCNVNQGFVMALLTLIYVVATMVLVYITHRSARNQTRPVVAFDLILEKALVYLQVRNVGLTMARRIRFDVSPSLKTCLGGNRMSPSEKTQKPIRLLSDGIPMIAPAGEIRTFLGMFETFKEFYPDLRFWGNVKYVDSANREYKDPIEVDLSPYVELIPVKPKGLNEIAQKVEEIKREIQNIGNNIRPLRVMIQDEKDNL